MTSEKDISQKLSETFLFYKLQSLISEYQKGKKTSLVSDLNLEYNNRSFSLEELKKSLGKAHDTACGPDDIHYQLLKHLPVSALQTLLNLLNDIWETGDLPSIWRLATVIPIPNPEKITLIHPTIGLLTSQAASVKQWNG